MSNAKLSTIQIEKAKFVGRAIAHSVQQDGLDWAWTGIEAEDADQLSSVGLEGGTAEWAEAERLAREAYDAELATKDIGK